MLDGYDKNEARCVYVNKNFAFDIRGKFKVSGSLDDLSC